MSKHNIPFSIKKIALNYTKSAAMGFIPRDEFETAVVNVFALLKFYRVN